MGSNVEYAALANRPTFSMYQHPTLDVICRDCLEIEWADNDYDDELLRVNEQLPKGTSCSHCGLHVRVDRSRGQVAAARAAANQRLREANKESLEERRSREESEARAAGRPVPGDPTSRRESLRSRPWQP
jgi:hypothetical protein